jgi:predicted MPP superfamily phosphohydrolase
VTGAGRAAAGLAGLAALGAAMAGWAALVAPRRLRVRGVELVLPDWPARHGGLRVAVVSDLHAGAPHAGLGMVDRVVERIRALQPDLVALLGDYVDPSVAFAARVAPEAVAERLGSLRPRLGVFAVLGNHDWVHAGDRMSHALRAAGITVLEDAAIEPAPGLWVVGLADERERRPDPHATLAAVPAEAGVIALAHNPDTFPRIPTRVQLTLSGHTHAGQVNVPGLRGRMIPSRYGARYAGGHVVEGGHHLYVTGGVGTSGYPVRLFARPEVVLLTLR